MAQRRIDKLSDDELFADWVRWIGRAYDEAIGQGWRHKMFRLMRCIYEQNTHLQETGGFFLQWAAENYVDASAMALRRELDGQGGSENLFHLLCEIRKRPSVLSRARFRSTWTMDSKYFSVDREFDKRRIVRHRNPEDDHIDPHMITEDLETLRAQDRVLLHVQTTIAHRSPARSDAHVPTFGDFDAAVEAVGLVFERYYLILTDRALFTREPIEQFNIYEPFRFAWIADAEQFDYKRCEPSERGGA
jgi:hypothetical protein